MYISIRNKPFMINTHCARNASNKSYTFVVFIMINVFLLWHATLYVSFWSVLWSQDDIPCVQEGFLNTSAIQSVRGVQVTSVYLIEIPPPPKGSEMEKGKEGKKRERKKKI